MSKTKKEENEKKYGLARYLQQNPQQGGVVALLRRKYLTEAKTEADWKAVIDKLLSRKAI